MHHTLRLAARGLGNTAPNPSVGTIIVRDGRIVGRGVTGPGGRPHAESIALAQAGEEAMGATLYCSLEPCCHHGKTPPCTDAIIAARIARVVIACEDPNPLVSGKGINQLRQAGIEVIFDVCRSEAEAINAGFFSLMRKGKPQVNLKIATSLDGRIASAEGESKWITSEHARAYSQLLRRQHDAVVTGIGTVSKDNPAFTCRLPGLEKDSPIRIVLDSHLVISPDSHLAQTARDIPTWIITTHDTMEKRDAAHKIFEKLGVRFFATSAHNKQVNIPEALDLLGKEGITRVLVEGGSTVSGSFIEHGGVEQIYWFRGPLALGDKAKPALHYHPAPPLADMERFTRSQIIPLGIDTLEIYNHKRPH